MSINYWNLLNSQKDVIHTKRNLQLDRRALVKGLAGAGLLSACQVEKVFAQTSAPLRVMVVALQHGWSGGRSGEKMSGSEFDFTLPKMWEGLTDLQDQCVFVDGLRGTFWGNAHDVSYSDILTAGVPIKSATSGTGLGGPFPLPTSQSIDYMLEKHTGLPALRFSANYRSFGAAYHPLSFNDRIQPLPFYTTPAKAYSSLFASAQSASKTGNQSLILEQLFPYLSEGVQQEIEQLSQSQANKLLNYLEATGELKQKLATSSAPAGGANLSIGEAPPSNQTVPEMIDSYMEMIRVAFANNTSQVAVLGIGDKQQEFTWVDTSGKTHTGYSDYTGDFHHEVAHYSHQPEDSYLAFEGYVRYNVQQIANFAKSLQAITDIDGNTLLDNTMIILTGEVGDGNHDRRRKPHIIIGGGNRIQRGRWFQTPLVDTKTVGSVTPDGTYQSIVQTQSWSTGEICQFTHADLWTKVANLSGIGISSFGIDEVNTQALEI